MGRAIARSKPPSNGPKLVEKSPFAEIVRNAFMDVDSNSNVIVNGKNGPAVLGKFVEFVETKSVHELVQLPEALRDPDNFMRAYVNNKSGETGKKLEARRFIDSKDILDSTTFVVYEVTE